MKCMKGSYLCIYNCVICLKCCLYVPANCIKVTNTGQTATCQNNVSAL